MEFKNYKITELIYQHSKTSVYRALETATHQSVILKRFDKELPSPAEIARYQHECQMAQKLEGPGIPKCLGLIEDHQKVTLVFKEEGQFHSLKELIGQKKLNLEAVLKLSIQLCEILGRVHSKGVLHKDIKPDNIVYELSTGHIQLLDFGIAIELSAEKQEAIPPEALEGTLAYISPEQTGRMNRTMDCRSDYYSLGVTLYELLCHELPFNADSPMGMVHCHVAKSPIPPHEKNPSIPPVLSKIILKLLEKNADKRYQGIGGLIVDLTQCLKQYQETGKIENFPLGTKDITSRFQIPQKLYGREKEVQTILDTFQKVKEGAAELLLVSGFSGIGKSSVVHEVHKPLVESRGLFMSGKYDQYKKNIPYSALATAFQELVKFLMLQNDSELKRWKSELQLALGDNGQVLIDIIPELSSILGPQPPVARLEQSAAQFRLNSVFLNFIRVFTKVEHPLVIFMDDLQWADIPTLELLKMILLEENQKYLMIIGAFRDNEVDLAHPLMLTLETVKKFKFFQTIKLVPFRIENIIELLCDTFKEEQKSVHSFADLLMEKTQGNPFFAAQFLNTLYQEKLIRFSVQENKWKWELDQIHSMGITDNVVELLVRKLQKLPQETQEVLKLAACIGSTFSIHTLSVVSKLPPSQVGIHLWPAVEAGLLTPMGGDTMSILKSLTDQEQEAKSAQVKFLHDRVQQASYSLIDQLEKEKIHYEIGKILLNNTPKGQIDEQIFEIIAHFNAGQRRVTGSSDQMQLIELNLIAAKKAKAAIAYKPLLEFLEVAKAFLPENSWESHFNLTQTIYLELGEAKLLNHQFDELMPVLSTLKKNLKDLNTDIQVSFIHLRALMAQAKPAEATLEGFRVLDKLGIKMRDPRTTKRIHVIQMIIATQLRMAFTPVEKVSSFPAMTDEKYSKAMETLFKVGPACTIAFPIYIPIYLGTMVKLTLQKGNHPASGRGYALYSMVLARIGDLKSAQRFQKTGFALQEKFGNAITRANVFGPSAYFSIWQWTPLKDVIQMMKKAYTSAYEVGNYEMMAIFTYSPVMMDFFCGEKFSVLLPQVQSTRSNLMKMNQYTFLEMADTCYQCIQTLGNHLADPARVPQGLFGKIFDESVMVPKLERDKNMMSLFQAHGFAAYLASFFGLTDTVLAKCEKADLLIDEQPVMILHPAYFMIQCVALLKKFKSEPKSTHKTKALKKVKQNLGILKRWATSAPMNFRQKYLLVEAELAYFLGDHNQASALFEESIQTAKDNAILGDAAFASERFAEYCFELKRDEQAKKLIQLARFYYQQWGALAKVDHLEFKYPEYFLSSESAKRSITLTTSLSSTNSSTTTSAGGSLLDLESVMSASRVISGEIQLERLLAKMMSILAENAGAQKGFILLKDESNDSEEWWIQASYLAGGEVQVLKSIPLSQSHALAISIVRYVARSASPVILEDAATSKEYNQDPWIRRQKPKSLLCLPIIHQGKTVGILYLENNLATHAFRKDRFELLQMICSQIAVSIENALLYASLEDKVKQRTQELLESQQNIRTILENIRSGVFTFGVDFKIHRDYSQYLHSILENDKLEGLIFDDILFHDSNISSDQRNQVREALKLSFDDTLFQYSINDHTLPAEINRKSGRQILELDWVPIENQNGVIIKIMVTLRDVTDLRKAKLEAKAQRRELDRIGQLIALEPSRYEIFWKTSIQDLESALQMINYLEAQKQVRPEQSWISFSIEQSKLIFRYLHTLKGNSRTFKLHDMTSLVHDAEQFYFEYIKMPSILGWKVERLTQDIARIKDVMNEYDSLYRNKLGRRPGSATSVWKLVQEALSRGSLDDVRKWVDAQLSQSLTEFLTPLLESLPALAEKLEKQVPSVQITGPTIFLNSSNTLKLEGIFGHILGNCMDFGIPAQLGEIKIQTSVTPHGEYQLRVQDNGKGLNIKKLKQKGIALGIISEPSSQIPSQTPFTTSFMISGDEQIAQLIFHSGLSTAEKVTEVSGRGVGMDAVKGFIEELGGSIHVEFTAPLSQDGYRPFCLVLDLPSSMIFNKSKYN